MEETSSRRFGSSPPTVGSTLRTIVRHPQRGFRVVHTGFFNTGFFNTGSFITGFAHQRTER
jgi:hypothetical protein